jgi:hypothetical protein
MSRLAARTPTTTVLTGRRSLADLMWVANTRHGPAAHWFARASADDTDHDHLETADGAIRYLADHDVDLPAGKPTARHLAHLATISDMVRALPSGPGAWTGQPAPCAPGHDSSSTTTFSSSPKHPAGMGSSPT